MTQPSVDEELAAVRAALYLAAIPSRCPQLRDAPLAHGVGVLLRIVADDGDTVEFYAKHLEKPPAGLREAAAFYIEQVMLAPCADSYRILGTERHAPTAELRRNLVLLCRWLHSNICEDMPRSVFFLRVTQAWNDLKTPERRAAYDALLSGRATSTTASRAYKTIGSGKDAKRSAMVQASQGGKRDIKDRVGRRNDVRKKRPRALWRLILLGPTRPAR